MCDVQFKVVVTETNTTFISVEEPRLNIARVCGFVLLLFNNYFGGFDLLEWISDKTFWSLCPLV